MLQRMMLVGFVSILGSAGCADLAVACGTPCAAPCWCTDYLFHQVGEACTLHDGWSWCEDCGNGGTGGEEGCDGGCGHKSRVYSCQPGYVGNDGLVHGDCWACNMTHPDNHGCDGMGCYKTCRKDEGCDNYPAYDASGTHLCDGVFEHFGHTGTVCTHGGVTSDGIHYIQCFCGVSAGNSQAGCQPKDVNLLPARFELPTHENGSPCGTGSGLTLRDAWMANCMARYNDQEYCNAQEQYHTFTQDGQYGRIDQKCKCINNGQSQSCGFSTPNNFSEEVGSTCEVGY